MARGKKQEELQALSRQYMEDKGVGEVSIPDLAQWAVENGLYYREPKSLEQLAKEDFSKALRAQRHTDPQGRTVRTMHPIKVKGEQRSLWEWVDIRDASADKMRAAFTHRRDAITADVLRHKNDVDSYNDNNKHGHQLSLFDYNFNKDIEEAALPVEYIEDEANFDELDDEV